MRIGPSLTSRWKSPIGSGGYGFNLDSFVGEDYQINFLENQDQQIKIESPVYLPPNYYFRLTFLEPESSYWKSIELIHENGDIFQRIECDDFRPISGILVPHHLTFLTKGQDGQLSIYQELDLIDATVNTTTFPMNFFDDPDPSEIKHVAIMKR